MDRLISEQAVLDILPKYRLEESKIAEEIKAIPSAQPKTGHWIDADGDNAICGCCNRLNHLYGIYCKHCGARMYEPQESEDKK